MIIVKNASKQHPDEEWTALSIGEPDGYGNPFQLIELRRTVSDLHPMTDYMKTKGDIEDTIITANGRTGGVSISYRQNGAVEWKRKNNIGPYIGMLARTPKNINFLVEHYGDNLWRISSPNQVENEVKALWENMRDKMTEDELKADDFRIKALHTHRLSMKDDPIVVPEGAKETTIEMKRELFMKEQALENRETELREREKKVALAEVETVKAGVSLTRYSEEHLNGLKMYEMRKLVKSLGIVAGANDTFQVLKGKIIAKQNGAELVEGDLVAEKVAE